LGVAVFAAFGGGAFGADIFGFTAPLPPAVFVGGITALAVFGLGTAVFAGIQAPLATPEGVEPVPEFPFGSAVIDAAPVGEVAPLFPGMFGRVGDCRSELFS
jgi:hypothetical protein